MVEEEGDLSMAATPTLRVAVQKPKFGIYYALLIIALCAMLIACGVLYKFIRDFGGFGTVKGKVASTSQPAVNFHHREHGVHGDGSRLCFSVCSVSSVVNS